MSYCAGWFESGLNPLNLDVKSGRFHLDNGHEVNNNVSVRFEIHMRCRIQIEAIHVY